MILRIITVVLLFSSIAHSKTLIVSDIDDTIKASHVRDLTDTISNAFVTTIAFQGMRDVYEEVLSQTDSEITYVTNAPKWLMQKSHTEFIERNFPLGKIHFRSGSSETHKYETIKKILTSDLSIQRLILVGDNGEADIDFYDRIAQEFGSEVDIVTYIRIAYAEPTDVLPLAPGQMGFVSPLELLADLTARGFIPLDRYFPLAEKISEEIIMAQRVDSKEIHYFPRWLNCVGYQVEISMALKTPAIEEGIKKVHEICKEPVQIEINDDSYMEVLSTNR